MQALQQRVPDPSLSQVDIVKILTQGEMVRCVKPKLRDHAWQEIQVGEQMCAEKRRKWNCQSLNPVCLCATPWTEARQAPLSIGFSRQEYWSGLPFPSPGDLPHPGIEPRSPALQADSLPSQPPGKLTRGGSVPLIQRAQFAHFFSTPF